MFFKTENDNILVFAVFPRKTQWPNLLVLGIPLFVFVDEALPCDSRKGPDASTLSTTHRYPMGWKMIVPWLLSMMQCSSSMPVPSIRMSWGTRAYTVPILVNPGWMYTVQIAYILCTDGVQIKSFNHWYLVYLLKIKVLLTLYRRFMLPFEWFTKCGYKISNLTKQIQYLRFGHFRQSLTYRFPLCVFTALITHINWYFYYYLY